MARGDDAIRVEGLSELNKALKVMEATAPKAMRKALVVAMEPVELVASAQTPRDLGRLQGSNKVVARGDKVILRNTQPYANTLHWGRKTLRGVPSVVTPRPWFAAALHSQKDEIGRIIIREVEDFVDRLAP
jgi:hypothetical protein